MWILNYLKISEQQTMHEVLNKYLLHNFILRMLTAFTVLYENFDYKISKLYTSLNREGKVFLMFKQLSVMH
jgi:hypothetical protein